jgi:7 transmembrane sweet-taste receptor of 3 GCPR
MILMGIAALLAMASMILLFRYRHRRLILQANHESLQVLCVGSGLINLTILFVSFDERSGLGLPTIAAFCSCAAWLFFTGQLLVGLALLRKLNWCAIQVPPSSVSSCTAAPDDPPSCRVWSWTAHGLAVAAAATLIIWTSWDRLQWERVEITAFPPETTASCSSSHGELEFAIAVLFIIALYGIVFWCAWKQGDENINNYGLQRSGTMIICYSVLQAYTFGLPMLAVVRNDPSPVVSYFVAVVLIWTVSVTVLAAMVWPVILDIIGNKNNKRKHRFNFQKGTSQHTNNSAKSSWSYG